MHLALKARGLIRRAILRLFNGDNFFSALDVLHEGMRKPVLTQGVEQKTFPICRRGRARTSVK